MASPTRQEAIVRTLEERGPMRRADLIRSQGGVGVDASLRSLLEKGTLVKDNGFYRLENQTIPANVLPPRTVVVMPTRDSIQRIKLEEREAMKKEFEKTRLVLVDVKAFISQVIEMLTPEEAFISQVIEMLTPEEDKEL